MSLSDSRTLSSRLHSNQHSICVDYHQVSQALAAVRIDLMTVHPADRMILSCSTSPDSSAELMATGGSVDSVEATFESATEQCHLFRASSPITTVTSGKQCSEINLVSVEPSINTMSSQSTEHINTYYAQAQHAGTHRVQQHYHQHMYQSNGTSVNEMTDFQDVSSQQFLILPHFPRASHRPVS